MSEETKVTDKRINLDRPPTPNEAAASLLNKVFVFVTNQPEFYTVLTFSREQRKQFGKDLAKMVTRFPRLVKGAESGE